MQEIFFPEYWDVEKVTKAFKELNTQDLYEYFGCANASSFSRLMNPFMPNKPSKMSYAKYFLPMQETVVLPMQETVVLPMQTPMQETVVLPMQTPMQETPLYKKTKYDIMSDIFTETKGKSHIFVTEAQLQGVSKEDYREYYQNRKKQMESSDYNPNYG